MSERLKRYQYDPKLYYLGRAAVRLIFQPSDKLEEAIGEFVQPDERAKYSALFVSNEVKRLHYTGADATGLHYLSTNATQTDKSDVEWLQEYHHDIDSIKTQQVPLAARHPRLDMTPAGSLLIEVTLLPSTDVRRKVGSAILRRLRLDPHDPAPGEVIYAKAAIPASKLGDRLAIKRAQENLTERLGVAGSNAKDSTATLHESPKAQRMFVRPAFINVRPIH